MYNIQQRIQGSALILLNVDRLFNTALKHNKKAIHNSHLLQGQAHVGRIVYNIKKISKC